MIRAMLDLDTQLFLFFNHAIANPVFDAVFVLITNGRFWILPGIAAALVFLYFKRRSAVVVLALSLLTVSISDPVCNRIIKPQFHRLRPCDERVVIPGGRFLLGRKGSESFPSSHAANMFAQATLFSLLYRRRRVWITAFAFAAVIAFSRVYVGAHYPLDVFGGAVFGMMAGGIVYAGYCFAIKKWNPKVLQIRP
ncbi:MAG TPA: phosphatase PAP2 family protein [Chitinivibrionales bacterium]|jgi:undecaprenyl-diphosphatase|nr:phosphatase PAP2 family protein [Chitinivibrionales bacterium]